jgi:hypothetical protein
MSRKAPKGTFQPCGSVLAAADSNATTNHGMALGRFTPCPEPLEEGSDFNTLASTAYLSSASNRGINPHALHHAGFMPRKCLYHAKKDSLSTGSGESFTPRTPSPRRQERITRQSLGFDLGAWNARGLGIVTRQCRDKTASPFWLGSLANRARKATGTHAIQTQSFD